jgi:hypothetical protein
MDFVFPGSSLYSIGWWKEPINPVILSVIHDRQNPLDSTWIECYHRKGKPMCVLHGTEQLYVNCECCTQFDV